ncbi:MAG: metallophosphatase family protein [Burkholderiales bacterium]|nr:metallophosphatase family protein [Burkholderiales bacterium]
METHKSVSVFEPGRACPLDYRYSPALFKQQPAPKLDTLIAAGGLYGNLSSLDDLEAIFKVEQHSQPDHAVELVFNGDFHWFDAQSEWFDEIEQRTAKYTRVRGNVETEFSREGADVGCGCDYPEGTSQDIVDRSNRIEQALAAQAQAHRSRVPGHPGWQALPMLAVRTIGGLRVAVVHGDAWSLAGWRFSSEMDAATLRCLHADSGIDLFVSSHTCQAVWVRSTDPSSSAILNNGAAGMPAFGQPLQGLACRVSTRPFDGPVVMRQRLGPLYCEWLGLNCSTPLFQKQFLSRWPEGSDAYLSYWHRIVSGTTSTLGNCIKERSGESRQE